MTLASRSQHAWRRRSLALVVTSATIVAGCAFSALPAAAATTTLSPGSLTTTAGVVGSGQTVGNLAIKDQTGSQDIWTKYVEFSPAGSSPHSGYRTYTLPGSVSPASVTGVAVSANYRGPSTAGQTWTWALYNWTSSTWTNVGTNATAPDWGSWKLLSFGSPASASAFVSSTGSIRVRLLAGNAGDSANLDFESVTVSSSGGAPSGYTLPPANGQFDYQLGGAYTPVSTVQVVSRDRTQSPVAGKYNVCYVNLFQTQPDEAGQSATNPPYGTTQWWKNNHPELLVTVNGQVVIDPDWNEAIFDISTAAKRTALAAIQKPWMDACKTSGFDAVEPDNLDSYDRSAGVVTFANNKEYLKTIIPHTHAAGLAIAQKNVNDEFGSTGKTFVDTVTPAQGFDFAIAEECAAYEECGAYTAVYPGLVYEIEYTDNNPNQTRAGVTKTAYQWACIDQGATNSVILRDRDAVAAGDPAYHYEWC